MRSRQICWVGNIAAPNLLNVNPGGFIPNVDLSPWSPFDFHGIALIQVLKRQERTNPVLSPRA